MEHTGRSTWPTKQARELWVIGGRRLGKSRVTSVVAGYLTAFRSYPMLSPGERGVFPLIGADREQVGILRRYTGSLFDEIPMLRRMLVDKPTKGAIRLKNHTAIEITVAHYGHLRGRTCVGAAAEEVAFWDTGTEAANPDTEVLAALRPSMATVPDALLVGISSPYAKRGELWRVYR